MDSLPFGPVAAFLVATMLFCLLMMWGAVVMVRTIRDMLAYIWPTFRGLQ